jgi:hypothetical protein
VNTYYIYSSRYSIRTYSIRCVPAAAAAAAVAAAVVAAAAAAVAAAAAAAAAAAVRAAAAAAAAAAGRAGQEGPRSLARSGGAAATFVGIRQHSCTYVSILCACEA